MDVGCGQVISEKWIPDGVATGLVDINGHELKTRDWVYLEGCTADKAIVGRIESGQFVLFFGSAHGSIQWLLDEKTVASHDVRLRDV